MLLTQSFPCGSLEEQSCPNHTNKQGLFPQVVSHICEGYWRELEASLPAVCCVWTPSTWGRGPSVPSSSKARIGFKGISGLSLLVTSNLDGLDPMGKFIISSKFSFWTDTPFSLGCFSKLGVLGKLKSQKWKELALKLEKNIFKTTGNCFVINHFRILESNVNTDGPHHSQKWWILTFAILLSYF